MTRPQNGEVRQEMVPLREGRGGWVWGGAKPPRAGGGGRRGCEHGSRHHTLPFMGAEVVLIWAIVFQFLRSGSRLGVVLPRGHLGYFYPPVCLVSTRCRSFPWASLLCSSSSVVMIVLGRSLEHHHALLQGFKRGLPKIGPSRVRNEDSGDANHEPNALPRS